MKARLAADMALAKNKSVKKSQKKHLMVPMSKLKLRTSKYLYTLVLEDSKIARIKKTLPRRIYIYFILFYILYFIFFIFI